MLSLFGLECAAPTPESENERSKLVAANAKGVLPCPTFFHDVTQSGLDPTPDSGCNAVQMPAPNEAETKSHPIGLRPPNLQADIAKAIAAYTQATSGPHPLQAWPFPSKLKDVPRMEAQAGSASGSLAAPASMKSTTDLRNVPSLSFVSHIQPMQFLQPPSLPQFPLTQLEVLTPRHSAGKAHYLHRQSTSPRRDVPPFSQQRVISVPSEPYDARGSIRSMGRSASMPLSASSGSGRPMSARVVGGRTALQGSIRAPRPSLSHSRLSLQQSASCQQLVCPSCPPMAMVTPRSSLMTSMPPSQQVPRARVIGEPFSVDRFDVLISTYRDIGNIDKSTASVTARAHAQNDLPRGIAAYEGDKKTCSTVVPTSRPGSFHLKASFGGSGSVSAPTRAYSDSRLRAIPITYASPCSALEDDSSANGSRLSTSIRRQPSLSRMVSESLAHSS